MLDEGRADAEIAALVGRATEAASAIVQGDMSTYLSLIHHAEDYTLMAPYGGPVTHGFDGSEESIAAMESFTTEAQGHRKVIFAVLRDSVPPWLPPWGRTE